MYKGPHGSRPISAGFAHTCAVLEDHSTLCWPHEQPCEREERFVHDGERFVQACDHDGTKSQPPQPTTKKSAKEGGRKNV